MKLLGIQHMFRWQLEKEVNLSTNQGGKYAFQNKS